MSESDDLVERHKLLNDNYDKAQKAWHAARELPDGDPKKDAAAATFATAQHELAEDRKYWRGVGESVDRGHDGARTPFQPKITNNDGSAK